MIGKDRVRIIDISALWLDVGMGRDRFGSCLRFLVLLGIALCGVSRNATAKWTA